MYHCMHDFSEVVETENVRKQLAKHVRRAGRKEQTDAVRIEYEMLAKKYQTFLAQTCTKHRSHSEKLDKQFNTSSNIVDHLCPSSQTVGQSESIENLSTKPVLPNDIYFSKAARPRFAAQSLLGSSPL